MASSLSIAQKRQLVEHKIEWEKDNPGKTWKFTGQLDYCQKNFNQSPSSSAISRIWQDRAKWLNRSSDDNPKGKRARGPKGDEGR